MRAKHVAIAVSLAWIVAVPLLANIVALRLYCYLAPDPACVDTTYVVVNWPVIAIVALAPVLLGWLIGWGIHALRR